MHPNRKVSWNTIKRYFRAVDIAIMRDEVEKTQILDGYDEVVGNADSIADRLVTSRKDQIMPPPPYGQWSKSRTDDFVAWSDPDEHLEVDPELQAQAEPFISLSELLTGFTGLGNDPDLALTYYHRLRAHPQYGAVIDDLVHQHEQAGRPAYFVERVLEQLDRKYKDAAKAVILLWYTGAFFSEAGFPSDFGTPQDNQYTDGLVWLAIQAHPAGYSTEGRQHWTEQPQANGRFTGLGNTAKRPTPKSTPES